MKRAIVLVVALALSAPSLAQESPFTEDFHLGEISFGLFQTDTDTLSSKFLEYRDIPDGATLPFFRLFGKKGEFRYSLVGQYLQQTDQQYLYRLEGSKIRVFGQFNKIPHRFGNSGRTLNQATSPGVREVSDTLQQTFQDAIANQFAANPLGVNYAFLDNLVQPSLDAANFVDLELTRSRNNVDVRINPEESVDISLAYFHEKRFGDRAAAGTSFGFSNVVETPEPVDYVTEDIGAKVELARDWGVVRGSVNYNSFEDNIPVLVWDNPWRAVDSTSPSAYTAPGSGAIDASSRGRMSNPPDNKAINGTIGTTLKLPANTRVTANATFGMWTQDETPFIPHSINSSITEPLVATDLSALPALRLDNGQINVNSQSISLYSRPAANALSLRASFRRYDLDNKTPRYEFPLGYVRFDAVFEEIPRISVPYAYTTNRLDVTAAYDFGPATLEGGYSYETFDRTFRETEKTTENGVNVTAIVRASDSVHVRATYELASRDFDEYEFERSEHASYIAPEGVALLPETRRFDQAARDTDRFRAQVELTPGGGDVMIAFGYTLRKYDFTETDYGLIDWKSDAVSVDVDYAPADTWNAYGYYSRDKISSFQRGRQSGAVPSINPLDDWTHDIDDKADTFGGGANVGLVPDKADLRVWTRYQDVDGNDDIAVPSGSIRGPAVSIPNFDDTKLLTVAGEVEYYITTQWSFAVGGFFEDYEIDDALTNGLTVGRSDFVGNYVPGSFFLGADNADYQAKVGYLRLAYRW